MELQNTRKIIERLAAYAEEEAFRMKVLAYGATGIGLLTALYRIRPFGKFRKPSQIPDDFLRQKTVLQGTLVRIEPNNGALLMVDHKPLIPLPHFNKTSYLPVRIAGIDITNNGISWLQLLVTGNEVTFVPVSKEKEYLDCMVTMSDKDKKPLQIGKELVKLGFATVHELKSAMLKDKELATYEKSLINAEKLAKHLRRGHWQFVRKPTLQWKIEHFLIFHLRAILPQFLRKTFHV